jgi:hypothetical protein
MVRVGVIRYKHNELWVAEQAAQVGPVVAAGR